MVDDDPFYSAGKRPIPGAAGYIFNNQPTRSHGGLNAGDGLQPPPVLVNDLGGVRSLGEV